jgi:hypothetical protein
VCFPKIFLQHNRYTDIHTHSSIPITLLLQQNQRVIGGTCVLSLPFKTVSGPVSSGSIDEKGDFKFDVAILSPNLIIHFMGSVYSSRSISGTYTTSIGQQGIGRQTLRD